MNRLKKSLLIFALLVSAFADNTNLCSSVYAQSSEAKELNRKGVVALESGRFEEAVQLLKKAMALEPKWGEPCYNASRLLRMRGKREEMIKMLRKANGVEPDNLTYSEEYVRVLTEDYEKTLNPSEQEKLRKEILRVEPKNIKMGFEEAKALFKADKKDEAYEQAELTLSKNSDKRSRYEIKEMGELYYIGAQIAYERGDLDKAKNYADSAFRYEFDNTSEAKELLRKVKEDIDGKVKDLIRQADAAQKSGDFDKAKSLLTKAEEYQPDSEEIAKRFEEFENEAEITKYLDIANKAIRDGYWLDAREVLVEVLEKYPNSDRAKKKQKELEPKVKDLLNKIDDLVDVPLKKSDRERVLLGYIKRGEDYYTTEVKEPEKKFTNAMSSYNKAKALIDADKALQKYSDEVEKGIKQIKVDRENADNWQKAVSARNSGDYEDVIKFIKKIPEDQDIQLFSYLAEAYYNTGNTEEAEKYAKRQLGIQPENNRAKFVLGNIKLDAGEVGVAHDYFRSIYESDPDYPEIGDKLAKSGVKYLDKIIIFSVFILLGWIAYGMHKKMPIYNKDAKIRSARGAFKRESYDDAIKELIDVRHSPYLTPADNLEVTRLFVQCYLKKGAYDRAIGECKHLITLAPKSEEAHTWLGYAYLGQRSLSPDALTELLNLYKKDSRNIALVSLLGSYYAQQKNLTDEGVGILEQWLNLDHDNVEVLKPLGNYYLKKNRSDDKAMKVFQRMMEIGSPDPAFLLGVANVYMKMKQYDNCLQLCEQVINDDINNEYVHSILLDVYKKQNRLQELLDIYANFLQSNPYNVAFQNGLRAAQAAYEKVQKWNAAQAANEAAAVMQKMMASQNMIEDNSSDNTESAETADTEETSETPELAEGEFACPACGKGNPQGAYTCQHCGANLFE